MSNEILPAAPDTNETAEPAKPQGTRFVCIGFNAYIDRQSISKLMGAVGIIMERRPRPQAIILFLSSDGGQMESAFYAYEIFRALPIGVGTHNVGLVASAANILFMAGNVRFAAPRTSFLFHDTKLPLASPVVLSQQELRLSIENIKGSDIKSSDIIAERINKPARDVRRWSGEKLRTAEFALEHGIISEIRPPAIGNEDEFVQVVL